MNPDGTDQKVIVNETQVFDYDWSPDGKQIVYARNDGSFASELYIINATGGEAKNITRYATYNGEVSWSGNGKKICFVSTRPRVPSLYVLSLQKPEAKGATASSDIDWEDIHLRVESPASMPVNSGVISPDGTRVAFVAPGQGGSDLWVASTSGGQVTRITTGNLNPVQVVWTKRSSDLIYFRDGQGQIRRITPTGLNPSNPFAPPSGAPGTVSFTVKMNIKNEAEFLEMFDQSWRYLADNFYDNQFRGADWEAVRNKYRPIVASGHVAMKEDLFDLLYLMMGELNSSHLGVSGQLSSAEEQTAELGLVFDETYRGKGLKIAEVLKRGPADKRGLNLKAGEFVVAIDGVEIQDG